MPSIVKIGFARTWRRLAPFYGALALIAAIWLSAGETAWAEPRPYKVDPEHFVVAFLVDHAGYSKVLGRFRQAEGTFMFDEAGEAISNIKITVKTASVFTDHDRRDDHLRSPDFLNASEFPEMTFTSTAVERTGERTAKVTGDLTLVGRTQPLTLDVRFNKAAEYPFGGGLFRKRPYVVGASARGSFKRSAFGINYGIDENFVGDEVELIIELEAQRQD